MDTMVERIKQLCLAKGISIPKLEEKLSFGRGSIYTWRKSSPSIENVAKVAKFFGVSIDYLFRGYKDSFVINEQQRAAIIDAILQEYQKQNDKWNGVDYEPTLWVTILGEQFGELCKSIVNLNIGWGDYIYTKKTALQVAATSVAFLECLDRNKDSWFKNQDGGKADGNGIGV